MKKIISLSTLIFSLNLFATSEMDALKERISALEAVTSQKENTSGIKVKNLKGDKIEEESRNPASTGDGQSISPKQLADIKKKLEDYKLRRVEELKLLEELDREEY